MRAPLLRSYHQPLELIEQPEPEITHPDHVVVKVGGAGEVTGRAVVVPDSAARLTRMT
jgi:hypothetical protein